MNKNKLDKIGIVNVVLFSTLYFTWIISIILLSSNPKQNNIITEVINLIGSFLTFTYVMLYHYPLTNILSKNISDRIEKDILKIRRRYAACSVYTFIFGCFTLSLLSVLFYDNSIGKVVEKFWIPFGVILGVMCALISVYTYICIKDTKCTIFVDKMQFNNIAIQQ